MQRSRLIDTIKGLAILLVILGHISLTPTVLRIWIYSFHMPLFFICSGLTFSLCKYDSFLSFVKAKTKSIVFPYFSLGILLWLLSNLLQTAIHLYQGGSPIVWGFSDFVLSMLLGYRLHKYYFSLWFLCTLFFAEIIFYFIESFVKRRLWIYFLTFILSIFGQWVVFLFARGWYLSLDLVPAGIAFISLGRLFRTVDERHKTTFRKVWLLPFALGGSFLSCYSNFKFAGMTDLYFCDIGNPILYAVAAFFGSWFVIILLSNIGEIRVIEYFGKNSLITYVFQNSFCIPAATFITGIAGTHVELLSDKTLQWLMIITITLGFSAVLIELINRCFPWMLGKSSPTAPPSPRAAL